MYTNYVVAREIYKKIIIQQSTLYLSIDKVHGITTPSTLAQASIIIIISEQLIKHHKWFGPLQGHYPLFRLFGQQNIITWVRSNNKYNLLCFDYIEYKLINCPFLGVQKLLFQWHVCFISGVSREKSSAYFTISLLFPIGLWSQT